MTFHYPAIEIRHEPDGELYAFLRSPTFDDEQLMILIKEVLKGSNNFSIRGVEISKSHFNFQNKIEIHRDYITPKEVSKK